MVAGQISVLFIDYLPDEILLRIFSFLDDYSLGRCLSVCKRFAIVAGLDLFLLFLFAVVVAGGGVVVIIVVVLSLLVVAFCCCCCCCLVFEVTVVAVVVGVVEYFSFTNRSIDNTLLQIIFSLYLMQRTRSIDLIQNILLIFLNKRNSHIARQHRHLQ